MQGNTLFLYTEEKRGNQLVESQVIGMISDYSGMEKMVVVRDPYTAVNFVYRIDEPSGNFDAVSIFYGSDSQFMGKQNTMLAGRTFRLSAPAAAMALLKGRAQRIQDKGSILAVLVQGAARRSGGFLCRRLERERVTAIPPDAPVEYLPRDENGLPIEAAVPPTAQQSSPAPAALNESP